MKISSHHRQSVSLVRLVSLAVLLSALVAGCTRFQSDDTSANGQPIARLAENNPTDVDLKHDNPVPRDMMMDMQVDFALRNQAEFDDLSKEIDDPNSPHYQQWLTPEEMHARFGETKDQFEAVAAWLRSEGFTITKERYGQNEDYIKFRGTAEQVENAFKIKLVEPSYDRYMSSAEPALPPQFVGVISRVGGLYGLLRPQSLSD
ncbi:MAG TPA: protease pro-enzyme activation domain-containing protein [Candidatus Binataceae bacterium]|nr:protease pro-enzyme activation domain-containing protein [Candidatus Binataceae bacterium]